MRHEAKKINSSLCIYFYYIPITDTTLELSVFWPSDTERRINELRFSENKANVGYLLLRRRYVK